MNASILANRSLALTLTLTLTLNDRRIWRSVKIANRRST